jgi:cob(I)alamin adenosyltransferase
MHNRLEPGLIQVYTGDGKGKTTAALGLALRAAGQGLQVVVIQFMKGWPHYGELASVQLLPNVTLHQYGRPDFVDRQKPQPEDARLAGEALQHARQIINSGEADLVILDEVNVALDYGLIELSDLLPLLEAKPEHVELVLTGRKAHPEVMKRADLVTEMLDIKHPFDAGVTGRQGIEY